MSSTERTLNRRALNRATLARQMLLSRAALAPTAAIRQLAGVQAQVPRPPFVGLWTRLKGFRREDLARTIECREVVRGTLMRGTIHLVARDDFLAWRPTIQPVLTRAMESVLRTVIKNLDVPGLVAAARAFFAREPSTFAQARDHLKTRFPALNDRAMGYIARMQLPLVQVPGAAAWSYPAVADFALASAWLGDDCSGPAEPGPLALRYFAAFGPATPKDFQTWSGLTGARPIVEAVRSKLRAFRDEDGRELLDLPRAPRPADDEEAPIRFLPEFDNLLLAYQERSRILMDSRHKRHLFTKNLLVPATFLVDGFVAGTWKVETKRSTARLVLMPFGRLDARTRVALAEEGENLLRFVEPDAERYVV